MILALVLLCRSLFADPTLAQAKDTKTGTTAISGRVTLKGEPVGGVVVALQLVEKLQAGRPNQNPELRAKTDNDGIFRIVGIPAGRYLISALAPGLVTPSESPYWLYEGKLINISEGESIDNIEVALKRGGVITGRVTDVNGHPLIEEHVSLTKVDENGNTVPFIYRSDSPMYQIDDRGVYRLFGLPAGRYLVSVGFDTKEGNFASTSNRKYYQRTFYPDAKEQSRAKVVEVGEGEEAIGIDISVGGAKKTYDVFGRVVDADTGQPVAGMYLGYGAYSPDRGGLGGQSGKFERTGAKGEFHLASVIPGRYAAFIVPMKTEYYGDLVPFEVVDSDVRDIELKVWRGTSISGFVVIEGTNDQAVLAKLPLLVLSGHTRSNKDTEQSSGVSGVNPDGSFRITALRPGKIEIFMRSEDGDNRFSILRIERGGTPQQGSIEIGARENISNIRVVVGYATGVVRGQLKASGITLPAGFAFTVLARRAGGTYTSGSGGEVDARGQFVIEGLLPGEYELKLGLSSRTTSEAIDQRLSERIFQFRKTISVGSGENQVTLTLDLTQQ